MKSQSKIIIVLAFACALFVFSSFIIFDTLAQSKEEQKEETKELARVPVSTNIEKGCLDDVCEMMIYSAPMYAPDPKTNELRNITDLLKMSTDGFTMNFSEEGVGYALIEPWGNIDGVNVSLSDMRTQVKQVDSDFEPELKSSEHKSNYKFTLNLSKIPDKLDYIYLKITRVDLPDFRADFTDLRDMNFTVVEQGDVVIIKDFSNNKLMPWFFDPTVWIGNESTVLYYNESRVDSNQADTNANAGTLRLRRSPNAGSVGNIEERVYQFFNFSNSELNGNYVITNATIYVNVSQANANRMYVALNNLTTLNGNVMFPSSGESGVTWNNQPCGNVKDTFNGSCNVTSAPNNGTYANFSTAGGVVSWDVTAIANSVVGKSKSFGVVMHAANFTNVLEDVSFFGKNSGEPAQNRPRLFITYTLLNPKTTFISNNTYLNTTLYNNNTIPAVSTSSNISFDVVINSSNGVGTSNATFQFNNTNYTSGISTSNMTLWLDFNEGTVSSVTHTGQHSGFNERVHLSMGNGGTPNVTRTGSSVLLTYNKTGFRGSAITLPDSATNYLTVNNSFNMWNESWTIAFRIMMGTQGDENDEIVRDMNGLRDGWFIFYLASTQQIRAEFRKGGNANAQITGPRMSNQSNCSNQEQCWYDVVVTYNNTTAGGTCEIWVNATKAASDTSCIYAAPPFQNKPQGGGIGANQTRNVTIGNAGNFTLDDMRWWMRTLKDDEIRQYTWETYGGVNTSMVYQESLGNGTTLQWINLTDTLSPGTSHQFNWCGKNFNNGENCTGNVTLTVLASNQNYVFQSNETFTYAEATSRGFNLNLNNLLSLPSSITDVEGYNSFSINGLVATISNSIRQAVSAMSSVVADLIDFASRTFTKTLSSIQIIVSNLDDFLNRSANFAVGQVSLFSEDVFKGMGYQVSNLISSVQVTTFTKAVSVITSNIMDLFENGGRQIAVTLKLNEVFTFIEGVLAYFTCLIGGCPEGGGTIEVPGPGGGLFSGIPIVGFVAKDVTTVAKMDVVDFLYFKLELWQVLIIVTAISLAVKQRFRWIKVRFGNVLLAARNKKKTVVVRRTYDTT